MTAVTDRVVGITGASGFVGGAIAKAMASAGWRIVALGRRAESKPAAASEFRRYDLAEAIPDATLEGMDAIVHAAYDPAGERRGSESINVAGARRLLTSARAAGVRTVAFVSSLAAGPDSKSAYGQTKFAIEAMLDPGRDLAIRPGLVAGGGGVYGVMRGVITRFGIAPIFDGGHQPVYVVDVRELARAVAHLLEAQMRGTFLCAAPEPLEMTDLYAEIASVEGVKLRKIALPFALSLALATALERCGFALPVSAESLRGIANLRVLEMSAPAAVGVTFSPARRSIENAGDVRA